MILRPMFSKPSLVAPFTGAWIEIGLLVGRLVYLMSLPSRGRGLKYSRGRITQNPRLSLPSRGRGLKFV